MHQRLLATIDESSASRHTQQQIVRYIHKAGLGQGSHIEVNAALLKEIGVSDRKLQRAMKEMVDAGVLMRRRRLGTVVCDPNAIVSQLWKVAVAVNGHAVGSLPFEAVLSERMRVELALQRCSEATYLQLPDQQWPPHAREDRWLRFPDLRESLREGRVDAVLTPCRLDGDTAHLACHVGSWEGASWGVLIDDNVFIETAYRVLREQAGRRFALIRFGSLVAGHRRGADHFLKLMESDGVQAMQPAILSADSNVNHGALLAERLHALPAKQRPDSLIIQDDQVAASLLCRLVQLPGYCPRVVVLANRQLPQIYPMHVTRISIDISELARMGVEVLLEGLRNPLKANSVRKYRPSLEM